MSGYASKREAMEVLKHTIEVGWHSKAPSQDPSDYYMERVFNESFQSRGPGYGWGQIVTDETTEHFERILARHLRPKARARLIEENRERQGMFYDMVHHGAELPDGLTKRDALDLHEAARDRVALMKEDA